MSKDNKDKEVEELKQKIALRKQEREKNNNQNKGSKNSVIKFILLIIILAVIIFIYGRFSWFLPQEKTNFDTSKIGYSKELSVSLNKPGCYEFGISSYDYDLQKALYELNAEFKIEYFSYNQLIRETIVKKPISSGSATGTSYTYAGLDVIESPFNGYQDIQVKLTVLKPLKTNKKMYFYVDSESFLKCGKEGDKLDEEARISSLTIETTKETDAKLLPLYNALQNKNNNQIRELIPSIFDTNTNMQGDRKPLHFAANNNNVQIIEYLIKKGANVNALDIQKHTPLYYAIERNHLDSVKILMDNGADVNLVRFESGDDANPALFYVACNEWYSLLEYLLKHPKVDNYEIVRGNNIYRYLGVNTYTSEDYKNFSELKKEKNDFSFCTNTKLTITKKPEESKQRAINVKKILDKYNIGPNEKKSVQLY